MRFREKPEQKFTVSPALPAALLAAGKSNNEKCTYNTPEGMKKAPEKL